MLLILLRNQSCDVSDPPSAMTRLKKHFPMQSLKQECLKAFGQPSPLVAVSNLKF